MSDSSGDSSSAPQASMSLEEKLRRLQQEQRAKSAGEEGAETLQAKMSRLKEEQEQRSASASAPRAPKEGYEAVETLQEKMARIKAEQEQRKAAAAAKGTKEGYEAVESLQDKMRRLKQEQETASSGDKSPRTAKSGYEAVETLQEKMKRLQLEQGASINAAAPAPLSPRSPRETKPGYEAVESLQDKMRRLQQDSSSKIPSTAATTSKAGYEPVESVAEKMARLKAEQELANAKVTVQKEGYASATETLQEKLARLKREQQGGAAAVSVEKDVAEVTKNSSVAEKRQAVQDKSAEAQAVLSPRVVTETGAVESLADKLKRLKSTQDVSAAGNASADSVKEGYDVKETLADKLERLKQEQAQARDAKAASSAPAVAAEESVAEKLARLRREHGFSKDTGASGAVPSSPPPSTGAKETLQEKLERLKREQLSRKSEATPAPASGASVASATPVKAQVAAPSVVEEEDEYEWVSEEGSDAEETDDVAAAKPTPVSEPVAAPLKVEAVKAASAEPPSRVSMAAPSAAPAESPLRKSGVIPEPGTAERIAYDREQRKLERQRKLDEAKKESEDLKNQRQFRSDWTDEANVYVQWVESKKATMPSATGLTDKSADELAAVLSDLNQFEASVVVESRERKDALLENWQKMSQGVAAPLNLSELHASFESSLQARRKDVQKYLSKKNASRGIVDEIPADAGKLEAEKREAEKRDAEKREAEKREAEKRDAEKREAEKLEAEKREAEKREAEKRAAEKREAEKREAEKREAEKREAEKREAEKREAEKLEAEKREAEKREAEKRAAEKREAEKREAEKREAEKREAEKLEAEKREADDLNRRKKVLADSFTSKFRALEDLVATWQDLAESARSAIPSELGALTLARSDFLGQVSRDRTSFDSLSADLKRARQEFVSAPGEFSGKVPTSNVEDLLQEAQDALSRREQVFFKAVRRAADVSYTARAEDLVKFMSESKNKPNPCDVARPALIASAESGGDLSGVDDLEAAVTRDCVALESQFEAKASDVDAAWRVLSDASTAIVAGTGAPSVAVNVAAEKSVLAAITQKWREDVRLLRDECHSIQHANKQSRAASLQSAEASWAGYGFWSKSVAEEVGVDPQAFSTAEGVRASLVSRKALRDDILSENDRRSSACLAALSTVTGATFSAADVRAAHEDVVSAFDRGTRRLEERLEILEQEEKVRNSKEAEKKAACAAWAVEAAAFTDWANATVSTLRDDANLVASDAARKDLEDLRQRAKEQQVGLASRWDAVEACGALNVQPSLVDVKFLGREVETAIANRLQRLESLARALDLSQRLSDFVQFCEGTVQSWEQRVQADKSSQSSQLRESAMSFQREAASTIEDAAGKFAKLSAQWQVLLQAGQLAGARVTLKDADAARSSLEMASKRGSAAYSENVRLVLEKLASDAVAWLRDATETKAQSAQTEDDCDGLLRSGRELLERCEESHGDLEVIEHSGSLGPTRPTIDQVRSTFQDFAKACGVRKETLHLAASTARPVDPVSSSVSVPAVGEAEALIRVLREEREEKKSRRSSLRLLSSPIDASTSPSADQARSPALTSVSGAEQGPRSGNDSPTEKPVEDAEEVVEEEEEVVEEVVEEEYVEEVIEDADPEPLANFVVGDVEFEDADILDVFANIDLETLLKGIKSVPAVREFFCLSSIMKKMLEYLLSPGDLQQDLLDDEGGGGSNSKTGSPSSPADSLPVVPAVVPGLPSPDELGAFGASDADGEMFVSGADSGVLTLQRMKTIVLEILMNPMTSVVCDAFAADEELFVMLLSYWKKEPLVESYEDKNTLDLVSKLTQSLLSSHSREYFRQLLNSESLKLRLFDLFALKEVGDLLRVMLEKEPELEREHPELAWSRGVFMPYLLKKLQRGIEEKSDVVVVDCCDYLAQLLQSQYSLRPYLLLELLPSLPIITDAMLDLDHPYQAELFALFFSIVPNAQEIQDAAKEEGVEPATYPPALVEFLRSSALMSRLRELLSTGPSGRLGTKRWIAVQVVCCLVGTARDDVLGELISSGNLALSLDLFFSLPNNSVLHCTLLDVLRFVFHKLPTVRKWLLVDYGFVPKCIETHMSGFDVAELPQTLPFSGKHNLGHVRDAINELTTVENDLEELEIYAFRGAPGFLEFSQVMETIEKMSKFDESTDANAASGLDEDTDMLLQAAYREEMGMDDDEVIVTESDSDAYADAVIAAAVAADLAASDEEDEDEGAAKSSGEDVVVPPSVTVTPVAEEDKGSGNVRAWKSRPRGPSFSEVQRQQEQQQQRMQEKLQEKLLQEPQDTSAAAMQESQKVLHDRAGKRRSFAAKLEAMRQQEQTTPATETEGMKPSGERRRSWKGGDPQKGLAELASRYSSLGARSRNSAAAAAAAAAAAVSEEDRLRDSAELIIPGVQKDVPLPSAGWSGTPKPTALHDLAQQDAKRRSWKTLAVVRTSARNSTANDDANALMRVSNADGAPLGEVGSAPEQSEVDAAFADAILAAAAEADEGSNSPSPEPVSVAGDDDDADAILAAALAEDHARVSRESDADSVLADALTEGESASAGNTAVDESERVEAVMAAAVAEHQALLSSGTFALGHGKEDDKPAVTATIEPISSGSEASSPAGKVAVRERSWRASLRSSGALRSSGTFTDLAQRYKDMSSNANVLVRSTSDLDGSEVVRSPSQAAEDDADADAILAAAVAEDHAFRGKELPKIETSPKPAPPPAAAAPEEDDADAILAAAAAEDHALQSGDGDAPVVAPFERTATPDVVPEPGKSNRRSWRASRASGTSFDELSARYKNMGAAADAKPSSPPVAQHAPTVADATEVVPAVADAVAPVPVPIARAIDPPMPGSPLRSRRSVRHAKRGSGRYEDHLALEAAVAEDQLRRSNESTKSNDSATSPMSPSSREFDVQPLVRERSQEEIRRQKKDEESSARWEALQRAAAEKEELVRKIADVQERDKQSQKSWDEKIAQIADAQRSATSMAVERESLEEKIRMATETVAQRKQRVEQLRNELRNVRAQANEVRAETARAEREVDEAAKLAAREEELATKRDRLAALSLDERRRTAAVADALNREAEKHAALNRELNAVASGLSVGRANSSKGGDEAEREVKRLRTELAEVQAALSATREKVPQLKEAMHREMENNKRDLQELTAEYQDQIEKLKERVRVANAMRILKEKARSPSGSSLNAPEEAAAGSASAASPAANNGAADSAPQTCPNCSTIVKKKGAKFCPKCRSPLAAGQASGSSSNLLAAPPSGARISAASSSGYTNSPFPLTKASMSSADTAAAAADSSPLSSPEKDEGEDEKMRKKVIGRRSMEIKKPDIFNSFRRKKDPRRNPVTMANTKELMASHDPCLMCNWYNPIDAKKCAKCGATLKE